jgi:hypothetical protein
MGLERVLNRLEANENTFHTLSNQYGQDALRYSEKEQTAKLASLKEFSKTLSEHLVREKKEENERLEKEGEIKAKEEEMERKEKERKEEEERKRKEEEGGEVDKEGEDKEGEDKEGEDKKDPDTPTEEKTNYNAGVKLLKKNKLAFDSAALNVQENGGTFQESEEVRNMSGWTLYGYTRQKAIMAGENYKAWMEGEMANNNDLQISYRGRDFSPSQANSLPEKSVAMGALRRKYLEDQGLLGVSNLLLDDDDVGFFDKVLEGQGQIMAQYQKEDAINRSFDIQEQAVRDFRADKDFGALVSTLATTRDKNNKTLHYRGALDKAIEIVKDQMDIGELNDEQLAAIRASTTTIKGKEVVVGKYWQTRFDKLEEDLIAEQEENLQSELTDQENEGKQIKIDFRNWVRERRKNKEDITEAHLEKWAEIYEVATGDSAPSFITNYKSKEDRDDDEDIKRLKKLRQSRKYLVLSDLDDVSEDVYEQMIGFVQEDKPLAELPKTYGTEAKAKIRAWGIKAVGMTEGQNDTKEFVEGYWNAYRDYERLIAEYIRLGEPQHRAQKLALQDVQDEFNLDDESPMVKSKYWTSNKPDAKRVGKSDQLIRDISTGISTVNKYSTKKEALNGLSETVIEGSMSYLEQGRLYKEGKIDTIPHYYRRLSESFKDLSAWDILDAQLKADGEKEGLGNRPEVLEVLDDPLLDDLKRKLNKLTTKNQIEQAKHDVGDMESKTSGLYAYSIFNTDKILLTPGITNLLGISEIEESEPKISSDGVVRTPPIIDRIYGDPGDRTPPVLNRGD